VIEQQLTGLDNLLYFTSTSSSDGSVSITVTFEQEPTRTPPGAGAEQSPAGGIAPTENAAVRRHGGKIRAASC
jgi:hypothetical protein